MEVGNRPKENKLMMRHVGFLSTCPPPKKTYQSREIDACHTPKDHIIHLLPNHCRIHNHVNISRVFGSSTNIIIPPIWSQLQPSEQPLPIPFSLLKTPLFGWWAPMAFNNNSPKEEAFHNLIGQSLHVEAMMGSQRCDFQ